MTREVFVAGSLGLPSNWPAMRPHRRDVRLPSRNGGIHGFEEGSDIEHGLCPVDIARVDARILLDGAGIAASRTDLWTALVCVDVQACPER